MQKRSEMFIKTNPQKQNVCQLTTTTETTTAATTAARTTTTTTTTRS